MLVVGVLIVLTEQMVLRLVLRLFRPLQLFLDLLISKRIRDPLLGRLGSCRVVGTLRPVSFVLEDYPFKGSVGLQMPHHI